MNGIGAINPSPEIVIGRHFGSFTHHHHIERHYLPLDGFIMYMISYE